MAALCTVVGDKAYFSGKIYFHFYQKERKLKKCIKFLLFLGSSLAATDVITIYSYSTNSWSSMKFFSGARRGHGATVLDSKVIEKKNISRIYYFHPSNEYKIYFGGGDGTFLPLTTVDIYDTASNSWSTTAISEARGTLGYGSPLAALTLGNKVTILNNYPSIYLSDTKLNFELLI